jgi:predicted permease
MLVVAQMALTLLLLTGAGLLLRTIHRLGSVDPGFQAQHVITFKVGLSPSATATAEQTRVGYRQMVERIRQIPGVEAADITALLPFSQQDNSGPFWFSAQPPASMAEAPRALYYWTGPDYLQAMQIPLLRGRYFSPQDNIDSEPVVVVDSAFAQKYFPNQDPVGKTVTVAHWHTARIIGEVGQVKHWTLGNSTSYTHPAIYGSFYQLANEWVPGFRDSVSVVVRTGSEAATILPEIKAAVYGSSNDQPVYAVRTMQQYVSDSLSAQSLPMMLFGAFAIIALMLAAVGIYGVVSYWAAQRVHEIGIRMALGAERGNILRLVVGHGVRLAVVGIAVGGSAALVLARLLLSFSSLLYGVSASDPVTFLCVSVILGGIAGLACYVPARRAASVDPMQALRTE